MWHYFAEKWASEGNPNEEEVYTRFKAVYYTRSGGVQ